MLFESTDHHLQCRNINFVFFILIKNSALDGINIFPES